MKVIPLGLQCSVPDAIQKANLREYSHPFDWMWTPSKTTYDILSVLINDGIDDAVEYMTTGYSYYKYLGCERYLSIGSISECQMNSTSGLGCTHFTMNEEFKTKLKGRLTRLLQDITSGESLLFVYADAASPTMNYHLDDVEYGLDATEHLLKIYELINPLNSRIQVVYFCWNERVGTNGIIEYVPFDFKPDWHHVSYLIQCYLERRTSNPCSEQDCKDP
jgi:hypothetical protein